MAPALPHVLTGASKILWSKMMPDNRFPLEPLVYVEVHTTEGVLSTTRGDGAPAVVGYPVDEMRSEGTHSIWLFINRIGVMKDCAMTYAVFKGTPTVEQVQRFIAVNTANPEAHSWLRGNLVAIDLGINVNGVDGFIRWRDEHLEPILPVPFGYIGVKPHRALVSVLWLGIELSDEYWEKGYSVAT
jgi:hypothetical protein